MFVFTKPAYEETCLRHTALTLFQMKRIHVVLDMGGQYDDQINIQQQCMYIIIVSEPIDSAVHVSTDIRLAHHLLSNT